MNPFQKAKLSSSGHDEPNISSNDTAIPTDQIVEIHVVLRGAARINVSVSVTSTVAQLIDQSIQKAMALNLPYDDSDTMLHLNDGSIMYEEDTVEYILDLTGSDTFFLGSPTAATAPSVNATPPMMTSSNGHYGDGLTETKDAGVYIQWITSNQALDHSELSSLPSHKIVVWPKTTIAELKKLALNKLFCWKGFDEDRVPPNVTAEVFTNSCHLASTYASSITLGDLKLEGTKDHPLDLYIVLTSKQKVEAFRPDQACGFPYTNRGIAAFHTCLDVFLTEMMDGNIKIDNMLEVIWEITHFPPAVIALRQLFENGRGKKDPVAYAVFASSFRDLSLKIVPPWISQSSDMVLESSRQIFAWLQSLSSKASQDANGTHQTIVHKFSVAEVHDTETGKDANHQAQFDYSESLDLRFSTTGDDSLKEKHVVVSKEKFDNVKAETLAVAFWGSHRIPHFYFNLPAGAHMNGHRRMGLLHPQDFDNIIRSSNQLDAYQMIGPLQLGQCTSSTLPVITLDSHGYVSKYDQKDTECSQREFFTTNLLREEVLSGSDPGQYLMQKLDPIIEKRQKENTWEIDTWDEDNKTVDSRTPGEAIVICIDHSSSMSWPMGPKWMDGQSVANSPEDEELTRLSEVKEIFRNLVTRISAYRLPTHLGLVTFSGPENVRIRQNLTPVLYDFQDRLKDIEPDRDTSIYDALVKATEMLDTFKLANPSTKCRIIVLTDGEDNHSRFLPENVCAELYTSDIVLDAIVIGTTKTSKLFKIAKHTGGYAFNPQSRSLLFQIFLLDGCIDLNARPDVKKIEIGAWSHSLPKSADMPTKYDFPPCRPLPNEDDSFISLRDANKYFATFLSRTKKSNGIENSTAGSIRSSSAYTGISASTAVAGAGGQGRLFMNEIMAMIENPHPSMDVYASESNIGFWKVVMSGPPGSPYEKGTFVLHIDIGDQFPQQAPTARFKTPILHPNITKHGRICHEILSREWHSGIHVYEVLQHIWSIFMSLEARDAVDPLFTLKFWTDPKGGQKEVEEYVNRFALKTRDAYQSDILGLDPMLKPAKKISPSLASSSEFPAISPSVSSSASTVHAPPELPFSASCVLGSPRRSLLRLFSRNRS